MAAWVAPTVCKAVAHLAFPISLDGSQVLLCLHFGGGDAACLKPFSLTTWQTTRGAVQARTVMSSWGESSPCQGSCIDHMAESHGGMQAWSIMSAWRIRASLKPLTHPHLPGNPGTVQV